MFVFVVEWLAASDACCIYCIVSFQPFTVVKYKYLIFYLLSSNNYFGPEL